MILPTAYGERATQYARDVVAEKIPSCRYHRLACERHLKDLERVGTEGFPYLFNPALTDIAGKAYSPAERICGFISLMPHIKGDWAARGEAIKLEDWQVFILASIFGWVHQQTSKRRFRVADLFVPRKNSKSTLAAGIGLYMLAADGEFGAEVYSGATSQDQALEVFRPASLMASASLAFLDYYGVSVRASNLAVINNNSKFEPVIGKPGDGASPSCWVVDEYHEHKSSDLYDTGKTGMGARSQPLLLVITTAGTDIGGPCYSHQVELQKILEGVIVNDQRFGIIFGIDPEDDWTDPAVLRKANPNFGISVDEQFLLAAQRDAITDPRQQNTFKTKHLNVWCAAASPWLNVHELQQAGDTELTLEGEDWDGCVSSLDLASKIDIASRVHLCWKGSGEERHYFAFSKNYVPEKLLEKPEKQHYVGWVKEGNLIATPGNMIDLQQIQEDLVADASVVGIREVAKDPWGGHQLGANLQNEGFEVVDVPQTVSNLSEPMKMISALLSAGRFHHDGNPCYVWQMSNVECKPDRNDNIFPRKARDDNKIDAAVATIIAMARALAAEEEPDVEPMVVLL